MVVSQGLRRPPLLAAWAALLAGLLLGGLLPGPARAAVGHRCADCHTMHNSQGGAAIDADGPNTYCLVGSCVGCHSNSADARTIVGDVPIVYNTQEPAYNSPGATNSLAGGNFYWVATGGGGLADRGHNVYGISGVDPRFASNPGGPPQCSSSCHTSLALAPEATVPYEDDVRKRNGCEGCHVHVRHHADDGCYRFLYYKYVPFDAAYGVRGLEDPTWEQSATASLHNTYLGTEGSGFISDGGGSISEWCAGCHGRFHTLGALGIGTSSPWLRHPTDIVMGGPSSEFAAYTTYDPLIPVGRPEGSIPADKSQVRSAVDLVTCLSCHRAHGSPYPAMLRWAYTSGADQPETHSCRTCHTRK